MKTHVAKETAKQGVIRDKPVITVDYREKASMLVRVLENRFTVQIKKLPFGDYQVGDYLTIERKSARDFLISIIDLRLFRQVANLKRHCRASLLLIEGDPYHTDLQFDHHAIRGALVSIQATWQLPVHFSESPQESCDIISDIVRQKETFSDVVSLRGGYRPKRIKTQQLYILQGLPGVGAELAKRLLAGFHSVSAVMTATEIELQRIEGIGPSRARYIRRVLDTEGDTKLPNETV